MTSPRLSILQRRRLIRLVDRLTVAHRSHAALLERTHHTGKPEELRDAFPAVLTELGLARLAFDKFIKEISL